MRSHFTIARTDAEQPWVVRFHADNGLEVGRTSENYASRADAERAVCVLAEGFYLGQATLEPDGGPGDRASARICVGYATPGKPNIAAARLSVPVLSVDERRRCVVCGCSQNEACDPPCHWVAENLCSNPACVAQAGDA
jgi:uncharacterized protein YegP (UPF0339 family)